ncbi:AfsR/SARP family transcriptional regulator [Streptomyces sp. NPDC020742]|uniref:AfsR/SARP family transcriptional regulator n=1 Tax=Streptomyces sp. NPDC020742 TaxID=3154897 RepID=UPI0033C8302F
MLFRVLGPLALETDEGEPHTPRAFKLRALLALLCLYDGWVASSEQLIDDLWSGAPPRTAATALQVYVSKLRKHLDGAGFEVSRLATVPPGYALKLAPHTLDLHRFDALCAQARQLRAQGFLEEAAQALAEALALWSGPAVADLRAVPALRRRGCRLDEKWAVAYEQHAETALLLGRHQPLIGELYGLIEERPTWEAVHGHLMVALYRSGRTAESLMVYHRVRRALADERGTEPGPLLQRLQRAVLSRDLVLEDATKPHLAS